MRKKAIHKQTGGIRKWPGESCVSDEVVKEQQIRSSSLRRPDPLLPGRWHPRGFKGAVLEAMLEQVHGVER